MTPVRMDYATPSAFSSTRERALLGLSADAARPVRFRARVKAPSVLYFRFALQALGRVAWSEDTWLSRDDHVGSLDPIITVHPDRVFFEAFSQDRGAYGLLVVDRDVFEPDGEVRTGTTNVDFTAWLWAALGDIRSSRETWLHVDAAGIEVETRGRGGRFEQKVDVPEAWLRGFLDVQSAMAAPGTVLRARPVDVLSAIRFLDASRAKVSPRALRFEMNPGHDARMVLEPWEHAVPLVGAVHGYTEPRVVRTWGRRKLALLEPVLPYAERVDIYLKGRARPVTWAVRFPGMTFVLGVSGFGEQSFGTSAGLLGRLRGPPDPARVERAVKALAARFKATEQEIADDLGCTREEAATVLERAVMLGRAVFDVEARAYRHRELLAAPLDEATFYPPDARLEAAAALVARRGVDVRACAPRESRKLRRLHTPDGVVHREVIHRDWVLQGHGDAGEVEVVLDEGGRVIFGTCGCPFFEENLLNTGPCAHMLALVALTDERRKDTAVAVAAEPPPPKAPADLDEAETDDEA